MGQLKVVKNPRNDPKTDSWLLRSNKDDYQAEAI
jgi:hypothetical protein